MCGLAGFIDVAARSRNSDWPIVLKSMGESIHHRGPDDSGTWADADAGIGLVHRRLSVLDLSSAGHQPMVSPAGRYVIAFNGEIYNHLQLRRELGPEIQWRGHSDTETLLTGFEAWGVEFTLKKSVGMFAFAVWDRAERSLYLARDRLGEKPLYYGWQKGVFLFGSELKALKRHPSFQGVIDRDALALLLRHNYIPAPHSIYKAIHKLVPGALLRLEPEGGRFVPEALPEPVHYWTLAETVEAGQREPFNGTDVEAVSVLESRLKESISLQMIADVPLGAFLSGGVDSSTVVALMQAQSSRPVKTFAIGFHEEGYNEAVHARAVAQHLGTDHTELYVTPGEAMEAIPRLPALYDEPFSDSSQVPTFLISQLARRHVTVSLSGDGGDELFAGYNRYFAMDRLWQKIAWMPLSVRQALAGMLTAIPVSAWEMAGSLSANRIHEPAEKVRKVIEVLSAHGPEMVYRRMVSHWKEPANVVAGAIEPSTVLTEYAGWPALPTIEERMMYLDTLNYLPDDILVKVDRAAMAVSLETRVPFLDHRVVDFAWRLPLSMKIRNGQGKWILRQVLEKYVPRELTERPKMGFGVPIDIWLRGPLRDWAEALLDETRLRHEGFFRPGPIRQKWTEHLSGQHNWQYYLWDVLMFQAWLEQQA